MRPRLARRRTSTSSTRATPTPGTSPRATTSRPSTTPRSPRWRAAATAAGWRSAARSACSPSGSRSARRRAARRRRLRGGARAGPRARSRRATFERREIPEELPDGPFDLIVCSEVLYYLDPPALAARRSTRAARHACSPSTGATRRERYPLRGDEVHDAAGRAPRPARLLAHRRRTTALERFDAHEARDRRRRPGRARRRARLPRAGRRRRRDASITPERDAPVQRGPPLSKEFLRGEIDEAELPIEPPTAGTPSTASRCAPTSVTAIGRASAELRDDDARASTPACSPRAPRRARLPVPGAERALSLRSLADARELREARRAGRRGDGRSARASSAARPRRRWRCAGST